MKHRSIRVLAPVFLALTLAAVQAPAAEQRVVAPGGGLAVIVSDEHGLSFRVEVGGQTVVANSPLGLEFEDGAKLGPAAVILKSTRASHDGQW